MFQWAQQPLLSNNVNFNTFFVLFGISMIGYIWEKEMDWQDVLKILELNNSLTILDEVFRKIV